MTKDLTGGSPLKVILFFTLPLVLGNLFQQFYVRWRRSAPPAPSTT